MPWQIFRDYGRTYTPRVSITTQGMFSINQAACDRFAIADYEWAVLMSDPERRRIGIMLLREKPPYGAARLRKRESGATVAARSFLEKHQIDYAGGIRRYVPTEEEHDGQRVLVIDLGG